ncbi:MAG: chemotaxis response regulator protein-glutamate methylesterase [Planctomycetes bacterium]|nr:chemotaxis response regulator protein-glutamate methylesterase [Planctomycetota bacterium]
MSNSHQNRISVLVVDDSPSFRKAIIASLGDDANIVIAGEAGGGKQALAMIVSSPPDLVTLDIEMPEMGGLETLRGIQRFNRSRPGEPPVGVIMVSAFTERGGDVTIAALENGAFDFILKPERESPEASLASLQRQLVSKINFFSSKRLLNRLPVPPSEKELEEKAHTRLVPVEKSAALSARPARIRAVLIGVSTGGPKALIELLPDLCQDDRVPIFIVQHMPATFTTSLAASLSLRCRRTVREAKHGEPVDPALVYLAPGGRHMQLHLGGQGLKLAIDDGPPEQGCRPSVDVFLRSALQALGGQAVCVMLTGMGRDGAEGLANMKKAGAVTIAQDEASSVVWGMPKAAIDTGCVDLVLPLAHIAAKVRQILGGGGI